MSKLHLIDSFLGRRPPSPTSRVRGVAVLLALGLSLTSACTGDGTGGSIAPTQQPEQVDGEGGGARVEEFDPDNVIVEQTVTMPTSPEDEVTWGVLSLRVEGDVMTLRLAVTPRFGTVDDSDSVSLFDCVRRTRFAPVLVDMAHLKEYSVITDLADSWTSDSARTSVRNGGTMLAWAVYPAPEDDIDSFTLRIADWWPAILDVPIER